MRILFFGCDDFAAVSLGRLLDDGHKVVGLVTQPDRPKGRGLHLVFSATKQVAGAHGVDVFQPLTLKDAAVLERLAAFRADIFVVVAYGKILPVDILNLPVYRCVNVHASLLPRYRGAAPVNWAVINGETRTGVTIMQMSPGMDEGDILASESCAVSLEMTSAELRVRLAEIGAGLLSRTLPRIKAGEIVPVPQDHSRATYAAKLHKELGRINWNSTARAVHDLVRGLQPWPGAFIFWRGHMVKILEASPVPLATAGRPGEIVALHKEGFCVRAADQAVLIRKVHPAGSRPMDARAFLAGHKLVVGDILEKS